MQEYSQQDLRLAVKDLHDQAETTKLAQDLISGTIDPIVYKNYCFQLYMIADAIEAKIAIKEDLCRRYSLVQDIAESPSGTLTACPSTVKYVEYLSKQFNPGLHGQFKGHIYTHYLGWLYGGQMIAKSLNLPKNHLKFNNVKENVNYIRNVILVYLSQRDLDEAKLAFEYTINIYKELYELY